MTNIHRKMAALAALAIPLAGVLGTSPASAAPADGQYVVASSEPCTDANGTAVGTLVPGQVVSASNPTLDEIPTQWVTLNGHRCQANAAFLGPLQEPLVASEWKNQRQMLFPDPKESPGLLGAAAAVLDSAGRVLQYPQAGAPTMATLSPGDVVTAASWDTMVQNGLQGNTNYTPVSSNGVVGWVVTSALAQVPSLAQPMYYGSPAPRDLRIYAQPSQSAAPIGTVPAGQIFQTGQGLFFGFYAVKTQDGSTTGWVPASDLSASDGASASPTPSAGASDASDGISPSASPTDYSDCKQINGLLHPLLKAQCGAEVAKAHHEQRVANGTTFKDRLTSGTRHLTAAVAHHNPFAKVLALVRLVGAIMLCMAAVALAFVGMSQRPLRGPSATVIGTNARWLAPADGLIAALNMPTAFETFGAPLVAITAIPIAVMLGKTIPRFDWLAQKTEGHLSRGMAVAFVLALTGVVAYTAPSAIPVTLMVGLGVAGALSGALRKQSPIAVVAAPVSEPRAVSVPSDTAQ